VSIRRFAQDIKDSAIDRYLSKLATDEALQHNARKAIKRIFEP
jgi:hypothetical protein